MAEIFGLSYAGLEVRFCPMSHQDVAIHLEFTRRAAGMGKWYGDIPSTKKCG
jgi:hypothetical protein